MRTEFSVTQINQITEAQVSADRVAVGGWPRAGKSTMFGEARHTDDLIGEGWSEASDTVAQWLLEPGPWTIEGVAVARGLRKALALTDEAPCDLLVWFAQSFVELSVGQQSMAKGCDTVLSKIHSDLVDRGVAILIV